MPTADVGRISIYYEEKGSGSRVVTARRARCS